MATVYLNHYNITVHDENGADINLCLRLDAVHQADIEEKYDSGIREIVFAAFDRTRQLVDLLDASLNWTGNNNAITSGAELFDILNAEDQLGIFGKQQIALGIAKTAGVLTKKEKEFMQKKIDRAADKFLDKFEDYDDETEDDAAETEAVNEKNA